MLTRIIDKLSLAVLKLERNVYFLLKDFVSVFPTTAVDIPLNSSCITPTLPHNFDGLLWAVPKKRRSVEKRLSRKFGWPSQVWKPLVAKNNLLICKNCGGHFEAGFLCSHCYNKVKAETEQIQKAIEEAIQLNPADKEIVLLYKGENEGYTDKLKDKKIVEMAKDRPCWFSKNLLEKTSKGLASTSNVKPSDLA